jgi:Ca2+/Na+ antiporter
MMHPDGRPDGEQPPLSTGANAPAETRTLSHVLLVPSSKARTILRYGMTAVALLLIIAAFLSIITVSQYHFVLFCVWMVLLLFFVGFCFFIQETVFNASSNRHQQIFHPVVHAMSDWIGSGIINFVNDCQSEYALLMLSNEAAYDQYRPTPEETSRTRPRTKLFRIVIQPIMNVTIRRRRKLRHQKQQVPQKDVAAQDAAVYTPPNTTVV